MNVNKFLNPLTQFFRRNGGKMNVALLLLILLIMFPYNHFFPFEIKSRILNELSTLFANPIVMTLLLVALYSVYLSGDNVMFVLLLFLLHYLQML